jgi:hypothetical protein
MVASTYSIFCEYILLANFGINTLASAFTLYLIYVINRNNDYNSIIKYLTISQFLFDASQYLFGIDNELIAIIYMPFTLATGVASASFSLFLCSILSYIVISRDYLDVNYIKMRYLVIIFLISASIGVSLLLASIYNDANMYSNVFSVYNDLRMLIIVIIIILILWTFKVIYEMKIGASQKNNHPIYLLAKRLSLYPIVQLISRLPIFFYQFIYGRSLRSYVLQDPNSINNFESILYLIGILTYPSAGVVTTSYF